MKIYFVVSIVFILLIIIYTYYNHLKNLRKKNNMLKILEEDWDKIKEFGESTDIEYLHTIYSNFNINNEVSVDDITWNDFEMDGVFDKLNYTYSTMGEVYLYNMLRNPTSNITILRERDTIIQYYTSDKRARIEKQYQLNNIGKANKVSIYEYINLVKSIKHSTNFIHIIIPLLQVISMLVLIWNSVFGIVLFSILLPINLFTYYRSSKKNELYLPILMQIGSMLESIKKMDDMQRNKILNNYSKVISRCTNLTKVYKRYYRFFGSLTYGKLPDVDMLYDTMIKPYFHIDIIIFNKLINIINKNMHLLLETYETVGFIDSMIAIAAFRHKVSKIQGHPICKPEFTLDTICYNAKGLYNPLINEPVPNTIHTTSSILITGSNATGKSTFLRTVGVNAILAQSIYTVCGMAYYSSFYTIMSSMNLKDNIYCGESYYMMEIKALKRIMDSISTDRPILCCIDEVLRGTNTVERIAASSKILESLASSNVLCIVASHDIELTYIVDEYYKNYHFQEFVDDKDVQCDFKLYSGRSYSRNAINLLKFIGFSDDIIVEAKKRADNYLTNGQWT